ncbi:protein translocase SEC61 complex subunit gamma [Nanoarchaeota archaeon]
MKIIQKIQRTLTEYWRVVKRTRKPDAEEFKTIAKISALGILIIGFLGFLIYILKIKVFAF